MSCLQPAPSKINAPVKTAAATRFPVVPFVVMYAIGLMDHLRHINRVKSRHETSRMFAIKLRVSRLYAKEEPVARGRRKSRIIKDRVIRHRQSVERQHPNHGGDTAEQDRHLKGNDNERRPR